MNQALKLLNAPEKRPVNEAMTWYKDGWQLLKQQPGGWAVYMIASMLLLLAVVTSVDLVMALLVQMVPAFARIALFIVFIISAWVVLSLQTGLYRSMARVAKGGKVSIEDLFWGFGQLKNQQFWFFIFVVSLMNLAFQLLENHLIGQIYQLDANNPGQILFNQDKIMQFLLLNTAYWLLLSMFTWAILPIMTEFPTHAFVQTFKRNLYGTLQNIVPLLALVALTMLTIVGVVGVVAGLSSFIHPLLAATFIVLISLWGVPLFNGWLFSAYRHIFTDW